MNIFQEDFDSTIFLKPTSEEEIGKIIFSLNSNKASGPNSIRYKFYFLFKMNFQCN